MSYQQQNIIYWDKEASLEEAGGIEWVQKASVFRVGSHWEKMFWRVISNNASGKDYYLCPEDYLLRSGVDPGGLERQISSWIERYQAYENLLLATQEATTTLSTTTGATTFADITAAGY